MACCEGRLTVSECWRAIRGMQRGKSPGSDGVEFYAIFFDLFGDAYVDVMNGACEEWVLSPVPLATPKRDFPAAEGGREPAAAERLEAY